MYTVIETPTFTEDSKVFWSEEDRSAFCVWLCANPNAGNVIPGSGGCRKVRWRRPGMGKSKGVRVIYFTRMENGEIWLLLMYAKSVQGSIPAHLLKSIREAIEHV